MSLDKESSSKSRATSPLTDTELNNKLKTKPIVKQRNNRNTLLNSNNQHHSMIEFFKPSNSIQTQTKENVFFKNRNQPTQQNKLPPVKNVRKTPTNINKPNGINTNFEVDKLLNYICKP